MINVLHLGLSYACNMKCKHCFVDKNLDRLNKDNFKHIIDVLYDNGLVMLYYTYGEPLLSDCFDEISKYAKQKGLVQILMTNGSVFTKKHIEIIKRNNVNNVFISLDHIDHNIHDENRGFNGAHSLATKAIQKCVQNNIKVGIATTVNQSNIDCLKHIYKFAIDNKVNIVSFLRERKNCKMVKMSQEQECKYKQFFVYCMKNTHLINVNFHDPSLLSTIKECYTNGEIDEKTYDKFYNMSLCHCQNTLSISPDGLVRCCNLSGKPFGDLNKEDIKLIIKRMKSLNENFICCSSVSKQG